MPSKIFTIAALLYAVAPEAWAHANGQDILSACSSLTPGHPNTTPQTIASPYTISFTPSSYTPGKTTAVSVTISGDTFKGFLIVASLANLTINQNYLGSFTPLSNTMQTCSGNALVHNSNDIKTSLTFTWNVPPNITGDVVFRATFVKELSKYWVNQSSSLLLANAVLSKDASCNKSKGCLSQCNATNCNFTLNWQVSNNTVTFVLATTFNTNRGQFMAVGFSNDHKMGNDSVLGCAVNPQGANGQAFAAKTTGEVAPTIVTDAEVKLTNVSYSRGIFTCTLTRPVAGNSNRYDLTTPWVIFFVTGPASINGTVILENHGDNDFMTDVMVNITSKVVDLEPHEVEDQPSCGNNLMITGVALVILTLFRSALF